jgi:hypothetical protein
VQMLWKRRSVFLLYFRGAQISKNLELPQHSRSQKGNMKEVPIVGTHKYSDQTDCRHPGNLAPGVYALMLCCYYLKARTVTVYCWECKGVWALLLVQTHYENLCYLGYDAV